MQKFAQILSTLRETRSTKTKKEALSNYLEEDDGDILRVILLYGIDPRYTFGVRSKSVAATPGNGHLDIISYLELLTALTERVYNRTEGAQRLHDLLDGVDVDELLWAYAILDRDLTIGMAASNVNSVSPGLIYTVPLMLAQPESYLEKLTFPAVASRKLDGVRITIKKDEYGDVVVISRAGHHLEIFPAVSAMLKRSIDPDILDHYVLDGEGVTEGEVLQDTMTVLRRLENPDLSIDFRPFDCIPKEEWGLPIGTRPYRMRMKDLADVCRYSNLSPVSGKYVETMPEAEEAFNAIKKQAGEGIVCKPLEGPYESKRSFWWIKWKGFDYEDAQIIDVVEGKGRYTGSLGSLVCQFSGDVESKVSFSGSDTDRKWMWDHASEIIGRYAHIKMLAKTKRGAARNGVFVALSDDK